MRSSRSEANGLRGAAVIRKLKSGERGILCAVILLAAGGAAPGLQEQRAPSLFAPGLSISVGSQPTDVVLGDLNGDGRPDIVTANPGSDDLTILLGDGRGGFRAAPGSPLAGGPKPHLAALGDVNRDGKSDLATTEHDSHDVHVFLGRGDGSFEPGPGSPFAALAAGRPHNHGIALGDFNGDGALDLATSNQNDNSVSALLGDGHGGFRAAPGSPFRVGRAPYPLALGDMNGDGRLDIVTPDVGSNTITVLAGDGAGRFAPAEGSPYGVAFRPYAVALGDLDGDRKPDIVAAHDDITLLTVLLNDGRGRFRPSPGSPVDIGERGSELVLADFDHDGKLDLATGTAANHLAVWLGDGAGRFRAAPGSPFPAPRGPWRLAVGDLDRDGKPDLVVAGFEEGAIVIMMGR
jgi:hypothetical protein